MSDFTLPSKVVSPSTKDDNVTPVAFQAPTKALNMGVLVLYCLAILSIWMAVFPILQILIPTQIVALDATHKIADFSLISALGALAALLTFPLAGAFSDRTTSRFGRRRPWIIGGVIGMALMLIILASMPTVFALGIGWICFTIFANITQAGMFTVLPDQVPPQQRALVSAFVGLSIPIGIALGSILIGRVFKTPQTAYYVFAGILLVLVLLFASVMRDEPLPKDTVPPFRLGAFLANFWTNPARHPDFGWAWLTRFLLVLSYACGTSYLFFFLQDAVQFGHRAAQGVSTFQLIVTGLLLVSSITSGILSDRMQRRKTFVIVAGCVMALGLLVLAFFPNWLFVQVAAAIFGLGYGIYVAVDMAMVIQVLPSARNRGKDMGMVNIAGTLPQVLAPAIIGVIISATHSYLLLFVFAAAFALLASAFIPRIKGVR